MRKNILVDYPSTLYGLDLQAYTFLSQHYRVSISTQKELESYLICWQYEALLTSLIHAQKNTIFYRKKLDGVYLSKMLAVFKDDIQSLCVEKKIPQKDEIQARFNDVLKQLPMTTSEDIKQNSDAFLAISQDEIEGIVSVNTSGSSQSMGELQNPKALKRIYCSANDLQSTEDFYFYGMEHVFIGDMQTQRLAMLMSGERVGSVGHLMKRAMLRKNIPCEILGFSQDYSMLIEKLIDFKPTCIIAIAWHAFALSKQIAFMCDPLFCIKSPFINPHLAKQREQIQSFKDSLRSVLLSGDTCSDNMKAEMSRNFACPVFRHFGMTEFGLGGAVESKVHTAKLVRSLDTYVEILSDKEREKDAKRAEEENLDKEKLAQNKENREEKNYGEIVITSLTREAMPLIRYKTGDLGKLQIQNHADTAMQSLEVIGKKTQGVLLKDKGFIHISTFQDIFCKVAFLQDFDIEIAPFFKGEEVTYSIIFHLYFVQIPDGIECSDYDIKYDIRKEDIVKNLIFQISTLFSLQYIEKNTIFDTNNNIRMVESLPYYNFEIPLEFFCFQEGNQHSKKIDNLLFPKKKIHV